MFFLFAGAAQRVRLSHCKSTYNLVPATGFVQNGLPDLLQGVGEEGKIAFLTLQDSPRNHIQITFAFENVNPLR